MAEDYSGEWNKVSSLAGKVSDLESERSSLQSQEASLEAELAQYPKYYYETHCDSEGNEYVVERVEYGEHIRIQLDAVRSEIAQVDREIAGCRSQATSLAIQYEQEADKNAAEEKKVQSAKKEFDRISSMRFGAHAASQAEELAKQRHSYYSSKVEIYYDLARGARDAADGSFYRGRSLADDFGRLKMDKVEKADSVYENILRERPEKITRWRGIPGESLKISYERSSTVMIKCLGLEGIPYEGGRPDFSEVACAVVEAGEDGSTASADKNLALLYGISFDEVIKLRKENGLVWRNDTSGNRKYLVARCISQDFTEGME